MASHHDSDGELADYLVVIESKKRGRSVSKIFKNYLFFEKETKPNSMKCRFKTNKMLTAVKDTKHTITTSDGKRYILLTYNTINFQPSKKPEDNRKPTKDARDVAEFCNTHKRIIAENNKETDKLCSSK